LNQAITRMLEAVENDPGAMTLIYATAREMEKNTDIAREIAHTGRTVDALLRAVREANDNND